MNMLNGQAWNTGLFQLSDMLVDGALSILPFKLLGGSLAKFGAQGLRFGNQTVAAAKNAFNNLQNWVTNNFDLSAVTSGGLPVPKGPSGSGASYFKNARPLDNPIGSVDPATIRFTQNSIKSSFRSGDSIDELISGLRNGTVSPDTIPPIRVFDVDGQLFSLDNRRLYAFQQAGKPINTVPATMLEIAADQLRDKFTTITEGISIIVRGKK